MILSYGVAYAFEVVFYVHIVGFVIASCIQINIKHYAIVQLQTNLSYNLARKIVTYLM